MKIKTTNAAGQKVLVEYEQTIIEEPEAKPILEITDTEEGYKRFLMCLRRSEEEKQYANGAGDKTYDKALKKLVTENHDLYMKFTNRLRDDLNDSRK